VLVLSDEQVANILSMGDTIEAMEQSFGASANGETVSTPWVQLFVDASQPQREGLQLRMTTLEDLSAGRHPGRTSPEQVTLFLSRGVAHQFSAVGAVVLRRARELGIGLDVPADIILQDRPS